MLQVIIRSASPRLKTLQVLIRGASPRLKHMLWVLIRSVSVRVSTHNLYFMEELRKLSQNYYKILLLNKSSEVLILEFFFISISKLSFQVLFRSKLCE